MAQGADLLRAEEVLRVYALVRAEAQLLQRGRARPAQAAQRHERGGLPRVARARPGRGAVRLAVRARSARAVALRVSEQRGQLVRARRQLLALGARARVGGCAACLCIVIGEGQRTRREHDHAADALRGGHLAVDERGDEQREGRVEREEGHRRQAALCGARAGAARRVSRAQPEAGATAGLGAARRAPF